MFLLIHGACHGGWCWNEVSALLQKKNNKVYTPTLIGMGERFNLLTPELTLNDHVEEIVNLIKNDNLNDIILVGHSYAGLVISAVNEKVYSKISKLVFLDAFIPQNNKTGLEILPAGEQGSWADMNGDDWLQPIEPDTPKLWGVTEKAELDYLHQYIKPFSLNFLKTKILLSNKFEQTEKVFIRCTKPSYCYDLIEPFYQQALQEGWQHYSIDSHHDAMINKPNQLADILLAIKKSKSI